MAVATSLIKILGQGGSVKGGTIEILPQTPDRVSAAQDKVRRSITLELESDSVDIERVNVLPTDE
jgi:hypothetical protein